MVALSLSEPAAAVAAWGAALVADLDGSLEGALELAAAAPGPGSGAIAAAGSAPPAASSPTGSLAPTSAGDHAPTSAGDHAPAIASDSAAAALESRRRAQRRLQQQPLPSRRQEPWRFTDTAALAAIRPARYSGEDRRLAAAAAALPPPQAGWCRLLLDGATDPLAAVSLPEGVEPLPADQWAACLPAADASEEEPWIGAIAAAAGPVLALRVRAEASARLELVSEAGAATGVLPLQLLLVLEPGARLELLQVHRAAAASLTAVQARIAVGAGAQLQHGLIAQGSDDGVFVADLAVRQGFGSQVAFSSVVSGWGLSRLEPRLVQEAGGARTRLRSLQRCDRRQVADQHSAMRFEGPEGQLDQLHKAIAAGSGRSVFNGAVAVPRAAQRTDAAQLSRSLLLSDRARIDTKPQLEIVADDVKCAHGATVTRLQQEELFYLRSRGISAATAGELLLRGFCAEVLQELPEAAAIWQPLHHLLGEEAPAP
jgi:FeS assembly protein SufD